MPPFITTLKTADNSRVAPANITMTLKSPSIATYKLFGFATVASDGSTLTLKTDEGDTVMIVPLYRVNSLVIEW